MKDLQKFWDYLGGLPRNDVIKMAEEELLDVRGLSLVKNILYKYNLSNVTIDYKLKLAFKRSIQYCPKKEFEKEQRKGN